MKKKVKEKAYAFHVDVVNCARCGGKHECQLFVPFERPPRTWTHWALCPRTKEPILMQKVEE